MQLNQETKTLLDSIGFATIESEEPKRWADCVRIAKKLQQSESKLIGFFPTHPRVPIMSSLVLIGLALNRLSGENIALLTKPFKGPLAPPQELAENLILYQQRGEYRPGISVDVASKHLNKLGTDFGYVLTNFSEYKSYGEHSQAASLCDGVVIVGERFKTTEGVLRGYASTLDSRQCLGVLLVDRSDSPPL